MSEYEKEVAQRRKAREQLELEKQKRREEKEQRLREKEEQRIREVKEYDRQQLIQEQEQAHQEYLKQRQNETDVKNLKKTDWYREKEAEQHKYENLKRDREAGLSEEEIKIKYMNPKERTAYLEAKSKQESDDYLADGFGYGDMGY